MIRPPPSASKWDRTISGIIDLFFILVGSMLLGVWQNSWVLGLGVLSLMLAMKRDR